MSYHEIFQSGLLHILHKLWYNVYLCLPIEELQVFYKNIYSMSFTFIRKILYKSYLYNISGTIRTEYDAWKLVIHTITLASMACLLRATTTTKKFQNLLQCISCTLASIPWQKAFADMINIPTILDRVHNLVQTS